ncbi:hypothetical protein [Spartinivicinus ruber]|nr:hypothetical protein [Spartinivicinus ruber]
MKTYSGLGHKGIEMLNRHYGAFIEQSGERYQRKQGFADVSAKLF